MPTHYHLANSAVLHCTETTFIYFHKPMSCKYGWGQLIDSLLLLDLKKSFDMISHKIMISKSGIHRINGKALHCFLSYLK